MIECYWQARPVLRIRRACFIVNVSGDDWQRCNDRKIWSDRPRDAYTRGINPHAPRIGTLAEVAAGKLFNQQPDFAFRPGGDNQDFVVGGLSIDVKATTKNLHCCLMVRSTVGAITKWRKKDVFILCRVTEYPDPLATVEVTGWIGVKDVASLPDVPSVHAGHLNKELCFVGSRPLPTLIDILRSRGAVVVGADDAPWRGDKYGFEKGAQ